MWKKLFSSFLDRFILHGALEIVFADGERRQFGETGTPAVIVHLRENALARKLLLNPGMALGEAYVDGVLTIEGDDLVGLTDLVFANLASVSGSRQHRWQRHLRKAGRWLAQFNPVHKARRNAAHHYDLSSRLYELFLDSQWQYSCAYFSHPGENLEMAQEAKMARVAAKLLLEPQHRVLDIGSGWGTLALDLHRRSGAHVTGITLSKEQLELAKERAGGSDGRDAVEFRLQDYREVTEHFDRIVSVGMFEHVGVPHYRKFFRKFCEALNENGVALLHTIGRPAPPDANNSWINKYIFPGGYIPSLSEIVPAIEHAGLVITDIEVLRLHYAETLKAWRERFEANRASIHEIYDERFCRMWRFYLTTSEMSFRHGYHVVFQIQMARRQDAVPLTRDYLTRLGPDHSQVP